MNYNNLVIKFSLASSHKHSKTAGRDESKEGMNDYKVRKNYS